jgi:hypothetical protein
VYVIYTVKIKTILKKECVMSVLSDLFEKLETSLNAAKIESGEFEGGKKAAALRLRKEAQVSKKIWQDIRIETMAVLKAMPTKKKSSKATPAA